MSSPQDQYRTFSKNLPQHVGPNVFPDFPLFHRLLFLAYRKDSVVIEDVTNSLSGTHAQLLSHVLQARNILHDRLSANLQEQLWRGEEVAIALQAKGGYEFAVGLFAILALGATIVPISVSVPLQEALYFTNTSRAVAIAVASSQTQFSRELCKMREGQGDSAFFSFNIASSFDGEHIPLADMKISSDFSLSMKGAGVIIFTSGTTGPPKGAVKRRSFFIDSAQNFSDWYGFNETDVCLHLLPVHHVTGISISFMAIIIAGAKVEFDSSGFSADRVWERWKKGGLTVFSGVPTMYQRMMQYFMDDIAKRSQSEVQQYINAARSFRRLLCGTSALPFPLQARWMKILCGNRILERYGGTEFGSIFSVKPGDDNNPDGSVGKIFPGVEVKLSDGDQGEVMMKSSHMFRNYVGDPSATKTAFTSDGWFKSGDIAKREGEYYFIKGRASIDIIKSGGYKISALDIEREILGLDYISEAVVVGVEDAEYGQKVAAAITTRKGVLDQPLTIGQLRDDLRQRLASYKLPLLLRIVTELPRTASGKVVKRVVQTELFPQEGHSDVQAHRFTPTPKL